MSCFEPLSKSSSTILTLSLSAPTGLSDLGGMTAVVLKVCFLHPRSAFMMDAPIWPLAPNTAMFFRDMVRMWDQEIDLCDWNVETHAFD